MLNALAKRRPDASLSPAGSMLTFLRSCRYRSSPANRSVSFVSITIYHLHEYDPTLAGPILIIALPTVPYCSFLHYTPWNTICKPVAGIFWQRTCFRGSVTACMVLGRKKSSPCRPYLHTGIQFVPVETPPSGGPRKKDTAGESGTSGPQPRSLFHRSIKVNEYDQ